jgi:hypothetical protein
MAIRRRNLGFISFLLALICSPIMAVQSNTSASEQTVSIEFKTLQIGKGDFGSIHYFIQTGEPSDPLAFRRVQRSGPYSYSGKPTVEFFRIIPKPTVEDPNAVSYEVVGRATVPKNWKEVLFFFERIHESRIPKNNGMPFKIHMMNDSESAFPPGSLTVFNACGARLVGKLGDKRMQFDHGPSEPVVFRSQNERPFSMAFAVETSDGPKLVFESALEFGGEHRIILMLSPPRREGSLRIQVYNIAEYLEPNQNDNS